MRLPLGVDSGYGHQETYHHCRMWKIRGYACKRPAYPWTLRDRLDTAFSGFTLIADATRVPILKSSGIPIADIFVACTQIDSNNVLMGEVAKRVFDVENVYVRLDDDDLTDLVRPYGITALCPHQLCLNEFELRSGIELGDDGQ